MVTEYVGEAFTRQQVENSRSTVLLVGDTVLDCDDCRMYKKMRRSNAPEQLHRGLRFRDLAERNTMGKREVGEDCDVK